MKGRRRSTGEEEEEEEPGVTLMPPLRRELLLLGAKLRAAFLAAIFVHGDEDEKKLTELGSASGLSGGA